MSRFGNTIRILAPCAAIAIAVAFMASEFGVKPNEQLSSSQPAASVQGKAQPDGDIQLVAYQEPYLGQAGGQVIAGPAIGAPVMGAPMGAPIAGAPIMGGPVQAGFDASGVGGCDTCGSGGGEIYGGETFGGNAFAGAFDGGNSYGGRASQDNLPTKYIDGVDGNTNRFLGREAKWRDSHPIPWEMFAYGEYIGPHRTPHVPEYRIRIDDSLEFVYMLTRERRSGPYRIQIGDVIQIRSAIDASLNQAEITVISDGMISLPLVGQVNAAGMTVDGLQQELNDRFTEFVKEPSIVVQIVSGDTLLSDLRDTVDARAGQGGQARQAIVSPDGTVQLPLIGSVPAIGLTLNEIAREVNTRYRNIVSGIEVTPVLLERAPRFIYVVGQVGQAGQFELVGPTTVLQAIALAEGDLDGGNMRNVVILRRDQNWRLLATRLDLQGTINGRRPFPSDDFYLRDSDIVIVPRKPIQRLSEAVNLYLTQTLYSIFPQQLIFDLDNLNTF